MNKLADKIGELAGCNVAGRLRNIYTLVTQLNSGARGDAALREISLLQKFVDPPDERNQPSHTPNGYDPLWVEAINHVLDDRVGADFRITDITDQLWDEHIGPMIDRIIDTRSGRRVRLVDIETPTQPKGKSK